jgi:hypothetical protein
MHMLVILPFSQVVITETKILTSTINIRQQVHRTVCRHIVLVPLINHLHDNWILIFVGIHELHRIIIWC